VFWWLLLRKHKTTKAVKVDAGELKKLVLDRLQEIGFVVAEDGTLYPPVMDKNRLRQVHRPAQQKGRVMVICVNPKHKQRQG
jgi:hypothetical protein